MWRSLAILVASAALTSALNLQYLDPTQLQTVTSTSVQENAARDAISRYIDRNRVIVEVDRGLFIDKKDSFSLKIVDEKLYIKASTGVAAVWGFNYYIKKYCKSQIEWQTKNVRIPDILPYVNETVIANDRFRYYQNVCTASYSFVWWNGGDWEKHIIWMALNGINMALAPVAQEAAWRRVYQKIGMTPDEIDQHFTGPAFLSWLRMGNVHGWGGSLPESWYNIQEEIQNTIVTFMMELGIAPVLPAFNGHVPVAFSRLFTNSTLHKVSQWCRFDNEFCCGLFIDPSDSLFNVIGKQFLDEINVPGLQNVHLYTADPFNEITISAFSTSFAQNTAKAIFNTLYNYDQRAVWLLQNWMFVNDPLKWPLTRVQAFLNAVPNGRMLILDLQSEQWPQYNVYQMYFGQPFIWCMLHNFGGTLGMFGNMVTINRDVYEVRSRVNSTMIGIGLTPEGINQNYVVYDLMLESAWRQSPVKNLESWAADYAERRYGCNETADAWKYLLKSVYSFDGLNKVRGKYVVTRRPSLRLKPWAWYKSYDLIRAFKKLVFANDSNCDTDGYRYDVVDVTRQALQYRAEQLYLNVVSDRYSNTFVFESSIARFLDVMNDMHSILRFNDYFTARNWLNSAWELGDSEDEKKLYVMNAKNQITLWGPKGEISDYACKQWAEMFSDYYIPRWQTFLSAALKAKIAGKVFDEKATKRIVTATVEIPFTSTITESYPLRPKLVLGDLQSTAKDLYRKWAYIADVEDLPIIVIEADNGTRTTIVDIETDSNETPEGPSVIMFTTPLD